MAENEARRAKDIFNAARALPSDRRAAYLDEACGDDADLRKEVKQLLSDFEAAGAFLESPTLPLHGRRERGGEATSDVESSAERLGTIIDRYKLLQMIGEGGFGRVYMAEQTEPVVRRVALKVIKLGMDTRQVIARFEAERQALAMMDHPNIAKVLDAGATSAGRPYFVMELVKGDPITEYCDRNNLTIPERLVLFMQVCRAVQHAHQKGIIHRDLKPSNVLITIADGKPIPKVIDFGIAKATNARLTEKTLFTEFRQLIGTPQYMSPEQAEASGVDIDTRSDIYSLGVLLYELLTGTTPFDPERLRSAAFGEIQRIIREEEPEKPSTRLSTLQTLSSVATQRHVESKRLGTMIRGDLDWIVMKSLEKDRTRRYETADALALDVQRHLDCEPVVAGPPSRAYRVRKFVRRHKIGVLASGAVAIALVLGVIGTSTGMTWALAERTKAIESRHAETEQRRIAQENERRAIEEAERAEREAERAILAEAAERERADELEKVADFQASQLSEIDVPMMGIRLRLDLIEKRRAAMERIGRDEDEIARGLEELERSLAGINFTDVAMGTLDENIFERALAAIEEQFADQPLLKARLLQTLSITMRELGLVQRAMESQVEALQIRRSLLGNEHELTLSSVNSKAVLLHAVGQMVEADSLYLEALEGRRRTLGDEHPDTLNSMSNIGTLRRFQGRFEDAEEFFQRALDARRRTLGDEHPDTLTSINLFGGMLVAQGRYDAAEPHWIEALEGRRRVLRERHPRTLESISNMGHLRSMQGRYLDAEVFAKEALAIRREVLGEIHPETLQSLNNVGYALTELRKFDEAEQCLEEAIRGLRRALGEDHMNTLVPISNLGLMLRNRGRYDEAEPYAKKAVEIGRRILSDTAPELPVLINNLSGLWRLMGRLEEADGVGQEAVEIALRNLGPAHGLTAAILSEHARTLAAMERFGEAESRALEAHAIFEANDGPEHFRTRRVVKLLADIYEEWHESEPGRGFDERANKWRERAAGTD